MKTFKLLVIVLSLSTLACSGSTSESGKTPAIAASTATEAEPGGDGADNPESSDWGAIPNARSFQGMLLGGQPATEQYALLSSAGYKTILDLRGPGEAGASDNESAAEAAGMTRLNVPVVPAEIDKELVSKFSEALAQAQGPVVVHCGSGNRVGVMFGMKAFWIDGASADEALATAKAAGMMRSLEGPMKTLLGLAE
ncbi:MAG: hypothetical protein GY811_13180 [Myxococcales bacterium]|nr:hypothetical protein [Myxococcales bacterium]